MNENQLVLLAQTYNTLTTISTKGNDTIAMAECLKTLKSLHKDLLAKYQKELEENELIEESEE